MPGYFWVRKSCRAAAEEPGWNDGLIRLRESNKGASDGHAAAEQPLQGGCDELYRCASAAGFARPGLASPEPRSPPSACACVCYVNQLQVRTLRDL